MKILIITYHYLFQNNGGSNGSKCFLSAFSRLYEDIALIYPEVENRSESFIPPNVKKYPCFDRRSKLRKGLDIYRGCLNRYESFVPRHLRDHKYDIIVIDHSVVASGIIDAVKSTGARIITIHHNVERDYIKDNLPSIAYRIPYVHYSNKAEVQTLECSCLNLCVTQKDCDTFQSWYPNKDIHSYYLGDFEYKPIAATIPIPTDVRKMFVISGSLYFKQSNLPILDFIKRYYPIIRETMPEWELKVTGRNPSDEMKEACGKDILLVPNPEDISKEVAIGAVYVCPIYAGSGLKLRIMDGLRLGIPILCHQNAAHGYEAIRDAGFLFEYHDEETFRNALHAITSRFFDRQEIYKAYLSAFSIEAGTERLRKILTEEHLL